MKFFVILFFTANVFSNCLLPNDNLLWITVNNQQPSLSKNEKTAIKIADSVIVAQMKNCPHKLTDEQRSLKSYDVTVSALQKNTNSFQVNYKLKQNKSDGFIPAFTIIVNTTTRETEFKGMN